MFAQLGIPTYGIRACAKVRDNKEELTRTAQELVIINLVMSIVSYAALAIAFDFCTSSEGGKNIVCDCELDNHF